MVIVYRDGRLKENDQILAINERVLSSGVSHQEAIHILQSAAGLVRLLVARSLTSSLPVSSTHDELTLTDRSDLTQQSSPADQQADMVVSSTSLESYFDTFVSSSTLQQLL